MKAEIIKNHFIYALKSLKYYSNSISTSKVYPQVINLLANDICNSKCTMCNIWKQKRDFELSPTQLGVILKDDLYKKVKHVGITGGEPTLREDLGEYVSTLCDVLPNLKGVSIITNAIREKQVIARIEDCISQTKNHGKKFSVMISLDGYGSMHDMHRGVEGNFESANRVIDHMREIHPDIPLAIGCTITKLNVWQVDKLLDFLIEENIYGRFRIGEHITRLYNDDNTETIRTFDEDEIYHLSCFFTRLIRDFEENPKYQLTYRSIIKSLNGSKRMMGCPYKEGDATVLDSRGDVLYCAPKSKKIGNCAEQSAIEIYRENLDHLEYIKDNHCDSCIHDYHFYTTFDIIRGDLMRKFFQVAFSVRGQFLVPFLRTPRSKKTNSVVITGWFGTETVGDKAILGGILMEIKERYDNPDIVISSIYPFVTLRTLKELGVQAEVVDVYSKEYITRLSSAQEVIMGGGPLMDMQVLGIPLTSFRLAKTFGVKTTIMGCGLGPLFKDKFVKATKKILRITDDIRLRDSKSVDLARQWLPNKKVVQSGDYAFHYVQNRSQFVNENSSDGPYIAAFLREWGEDYKDNLTQEEFENTKNDFEVKLFGELRELSTALAMPIKFFCMHTFTVGGDDRIFYRNMVEKYGLDPSMFLIDEFPSSVDGIIKAMKSSKFNLCMRFHSVLFAETLGVDYFAIDYTNGGKISNLLNDLKKKKRFITLRDYSKEQDSIIFEKAMEVIKAL